MSVQNEINKATHSLNKIAENLDVDLRKILAQTSQHIFDETLEGAERHRQTGALARSVFLWPEKDAYEIGIDPQIAPHAQFVHFPTRPHLIKPKNKKALRWASGGAFNFAKVVNHPGYKGDPFFYDAVDSGMRFLDQQAERLKLRD